MISGVGAVAICDYTGRHVFSARTRRLAISALGTTSGVSYANGHNEHHRGLQRCATRV